MDSRAFTISLRWLEHGRIERMDYDDLIRDVRETADRGEYFYSITHYAYIGRKR
jgi:hypothetical protein